MEEIQKNSKNQEELKNSERFKRIKKNRKIQKDSKESERMKEIQKDLDGKPERIKTEIKGIFRRSLESENKRETGVTSQMLYSDMIGHQTYSKVPKFQKKRNMISRNSRKMR